MTTEQLIDWILQREGGFVDDSADRGGPTSFGITASNWGSFKGLGRPATRAEVKAITREQAIDFYRVSYVARSPFTAVRYEPLFVQLVDYAVLSGTARATRWLQRVLGVPVTSAMDDRTMTALRRERGELVNNALVAARIQMFHRIVAEDATQERFLKGWTTRALGFIMIPMT